MNGDRPEAGRETLFEFIRRAFQHQATGASNAGTESAPAPEAGDRSGGEITPGELRRRLAAGGPLYLVDVREETDLRTQGSIEGSVSIPMSRFPGRINEVRLDCPVVVYCQDGTESPAAAAMLRARGVRDVRALAGGFARWRAEARARS